jgi:hypothetical protein
MRLIKFFLQETRLEELKSLISQALTGVVATAAKLKAKSGFAGTSKRIRKL